MVRSDVFIALEVTADVALVCWNNDDWLVFSRFVLLAAANAAEVILEVALVYWRAARSDVFIRLLLLPARNKSESLTERISVLLVPEIVTLFPPSRYSLDPCVADVCPAVLDPSSSQACINLVVSPPDGAATEREMPALPIVAETFVKFREADEYTKLEPMFFGIHEEPFQ